MTGCLPTDDRPLELLRRGLAAKLSVDLGRAEQAAALYLEAAELATVLAEELTARGR